MASIDLLRPASLRRWLWLLTAHVLLLLGALSSLATAAVPTPPGGPILVVTASSTKYRDFYPEILRTEGLNAYAVADVSQLNAATLASYDVVLLGPTTLTATQVTALTDWVNGGGSLIALAPDSQLNALLGVTAAGTAVNNGYLGVDTSGPPGNGITGQTMQIHASAARYALNGATRVATLYTNATTATTNPAVTLRTVGSGRAAAFAYDLVSSIVLTRQGNPAWAGDERDGFAPVRSDDMFFGAKAGDVQPDWVDLSKVAIPQADEQQRLLVNLILHMSQARKPLPRFWYFPRGEKAVIIMTGDDHGNNGTEGRFNQFNALSPSGCSVESWDCIRGTSYIYAHTPISPAQAAAFQSQGHEVGVHIYTACNDYTTASLTETYDVQIADWQSAFPGLNAPSTQRHHCIVWSGWSNGASVQLAHGIRLDTNFYYWPPSWANDVPGVFSGSAMPMRFVDNSAAGALIDVFQAVTQMTDESGQTYPFTSDTLLDRAVGAQEYYGAYTVNAHTDSAQSPVADAVIESALARGVPIVSARQMLTWLDGKHGSSFGSFTWNGSALGFGITPAAGSTGLQAMLPTRFNGLALGTVTRGGNAVSTTVRTVKGVEYAFFNAVAGLYTANYGADSGAPSVSGTLPSAGATGVAPGVTVSATFSEAMDPATINGSTFELRTSGNTLVPATVSYNAQSRVASLQPSSALAAGASYTATVRGGASDPTVRDAAGNAMLASFTWGFTVAAGVPAPTCPCTGWPDTSTPANPSENDPNPVELGVKFTSDTAGFITGIRFYKGSGNTGPHKGNLWTSGGTLLATADFSSGTATGWQTVTFGSPVAIQPNVLYVASYHTASGNYAGDNNYFATTGVDRPPIHFPRSGAVAGGNGVYAYGSTSQFPQQTYQASNYWVDVVFVTSTGPDTTPPTALSTTPVNGATDVATSTAPTARFNEPLNPATVSASTFELRNAANQVVPATISYDGANATARLTPTAPLAAGTVYTATVRGGTTDPRIKDVAGNALASSLVWSFTTASNGPCVAPANSIVAENCLVGNPSSEWDINGAGDASIQGFATQISVNRGETVGFKVDTNATAYRFDIYRMGYYGGMGARKVATVLPSAALPQNQPNCLNQAATGLIDCGNWALSGSWAVPANATSGIYFAKLVRTDGTAGSSHIVFIVRNDAGAADVVFQTSDTTWQAYNNYGGNSLYTGSPAGRAYKVSYNRPFNTRAVDGGQDWVFNAEYPMVRWLESNGYNVTYVTGVDVDRSPQVLGSRRAFLSVGHDEYWSGTQRANVEAARNAGMHLAFFSGNEVFWKTRWETSIDGSGTAHRTLVCYKETHANAKIDPTSAWTGTWRDPRFSPPADGGRPENALTGTLFMVNAGATTAIQVPAADGRMRLWRNTSIASLPANGVATLTPGTLGYEWDVDADNAARPPGLFRMATRTVSNAPILVDHGSTFGSGTAVHAVTMYRHASGARVFSAGSVQWSWGLDAEHDRGIFPDPNPDPIAPEPDPRMQQATVNLLADMGVQPGTLRSGLVPATASSDAVAASSAVTSPTTGATLPLNTAVTITGTASDSGGGVVGGVEVSVDNGATWRRANGRENWTFSWTPTTAGTATIRSRAVDDSGNLESPSAGVTVNTGSGGGGDVTPPTVTTVVPASNATGVAPGTTVRATFSEAMNASTIGTSTFELRDNAGTLVASSVTYDSTSRIATLTPGQPLAGGVVYTATVRGGTTDPRVKDVANNALAASRVWSFTIESTAPTVTTIVPASNATGVSATTTVRATFSEAMNASTIGGSTFELRDNLGALVAASVTYDTTSRVATLTPSQALVGGRTYTATVRGGATDPRVKDLAGNALASSRVWSFTVETTAPTVTSISPSNGAILVGRGTNVTATFSEAMDAATINGSTVELRGPSGNLVSAVVTYSATNRRATLNPVNNLAALTQYTVTVRGGGTDPRVKDAAGNAMAANRTWSFTTR